MSHNAPSQQSGTLIIHTLKGRSLPEGVAAAVGYAQAAMDPHTPPTIATAFANHSGDTMRRHQEHQTLLAQHFHVQRQGNQQITICLIIAGVICILGGAGMCIAFGAESDTNSTAATAGGESGGAAIILAGLAFLRSVMKDHSSSATETPIDPRNQTTYNGPAP